MCNETTIFKKHLTKVYFVKLEMVLKTITHSEEYWMGKDDRDVVAWETRTTHEEVPSHILANFTELDVNTSVPKVSLPKGLDIVFPYTWNNASESTKLDRKQTVSVKFPLQEDWENLKNAYSYAWIHRGIKGDYLIPDSFYEPLLWFNGDLIEDFRGKNRASHEDYMEYSRLLNQFVEESFPELGLNLDERYKIYKEEG